GEESTCRHALDLAAQELDHGPSSEDLPYLALNTAHLARWRGNCLITFGDPETPDELAAALNVRGEPEEARRHLRRARELAQLTGSARQRRRIRDLSRRIGKAA